MVVLRFMSWCLKFLCCWRLRYVFIFLVKDLCVVTVYTCLKIYLYKKALFIFVNNATFFSMLYHWAVEYVSNVKICVYMIVK